MSRNEHKRQKQLAKKAKRSQQVRKVLQHARSLSTADIILETLRAPFYAIDLTGDESMKSISVLRTRPNGEVVMVGFLVDTLGLGVKEAFIQRNIDVEKYRQMQSNQGAEPCKPEYAYKCILGAIDFARKFGLEPHPETDKALLVFKGVDPELCKEEFVYGEDGKPLYIPGPYDDASKISFIAQKLAAAIGEMPAVVLSLDQAQQSISHPYLLEEPDRDPAYDEDEDNVH